MKNPIKELQQNEKLLTIKNKYGFLGHSFLIPALIMLCIYFAIGHKPFGQMSVLTLDLNAQYVYFYEALRDAVWGDGSLLYSFSRSLGGEFMGIYAYYLASPLSYIVCLLPKTMMLEALLIIICTKIGLCGLSFAFYLSKQKGYMKPQNIILFATMYALSAYAITYQNNIMWLDGLFLLPILTWSIERLVKEGRYKLYIITLAVMMMSHYYIGYMLCWYTAFCFFFTYFKDEDRSFVTPGKPKMHFFKSIFKIGASTVLGIGIAAFMIAAAYYSLQFGKSDFTDPNWDLVARFDLFDLFPKMLPGGYDTVMHEGLPLLYCGTLTLFMLPIYIMAKRVPSREKVFYTAFIILYVLIMVINPADLVMHGFQAPNCLNYRYSFIVIFLMLVMAFKGFSEIQEHSAKKVFATGGALIAMLLIAQKMDFPNFVAQDTEDYKFGFIAGELHFLMVVVFSLIAIFAVGAAVCYLIKSENKEKMSKVLLGIVCFELFANGVILTANLAFDVGIATYDSYAVYFKDIRPIVATIQEYDKTFYRMEKTTHRCTNDNMALGMKGLSNSTSTLNASVIGLLDALGLYADAHWTQYIGQTVLTESLFGVKYIVSNTENETNKESLTENALMDKYYELVSEDEKYYAYENPYALSIGFGSDKAISDLDLQIYFDFYKNDEKEDEDKQSYINAFEAQNMLMNAILGNGEDEQIEFFTPIRLRNGNTMTGASLARGEGKEYGIKTSDIENTRIYFNITVEKSGPLYLFLPSRWERTATYFVNEEEYVTNYTHSRIINLGYREAGEELEISIRANEGSFYFYGSTDYFYTLDMEAFEAAYEELSETMIKTTEDSSDDHIYGAITTHENNKTILTTIPYDEGWKVIVDGNEVDTYSVLEGSMMAFEIENVGEHDIELIYMPDIYVVSAIISIVSTVIFAIIVAHDIIKKKKCPSPAVPAESEEASNSEPTQIAQNSENTEEQGET